MTDRPKRIQRKRAAGWRMPEGAVYVGRPSKWGSPFDFRRSDHCWTALSYGCRGDAKGRQEASVKAFRLWLFEGDMRPRVSTEFRVGLGNDTEFCPLSPMVKAGRAPTTDEIRAALAGRDLACWCPPGQPCHADVLLEVANGLACDAPEGERG